MITTDQQVKLLMQKLKKHNQEIAAAKAGMDVKTARKYLQSGQLPSEMKAAHTWKTRPDAFALHWPECAQMLETSPRLEAKTLLEYLIRQYPEHYTIHQMRTFRRRVSNWRAEFGALNPIIFNQELKPGRQSQSDFTNMNELNITINRQPFNHLLFHFMLPYSCWESIQLCFSESFESLVTGFEKAVWELGYVVKEHRTDNLTAATKAMGGSRREFTERWQEVMKYYDIIPTTNNIGVSNENGSVEKSHDLLKKAIDQQLLLRGYRDFDSQKAYVQWVEELVASRNHYRKERLLEEIPLLNELPDKKWHSPTIVTVRVSTGSLIHVLGETYTVPSRLIHYSLKAYIYPEEIILFHGNKILQKMPRIYEGSLAGINYRHLIDALIRKPGAFAQYRYREAMFPYPCFREAYEKLQRNKPANADKLYLQLLQLAKVHSEHQVCEALILLLEDGQLPIAETVKSLVDVVQEERLKVHVNEPHLADYDHLLSGFMPMEVH